MDNNLEAAKTYFEEEVSVRKKHAASGFILTTMGAFINGIGLDEFMRSDIKGGIIALALGSTALFVGGHEAKKGIQEYGQYKTKLGSVMNQIKQSPEETI